MKNFIFGLMGLCFCFLFVNPAQAFYSDMEENHWAYSQIKILTEKNVAVGYPDGSFHPDENVTRAEFASMAIKALGQENTTIAQPINFARQNGYSVVREIGGHGIGLEFHEEPFVSYVSRKGTEMLMVPGMIFTIEPMINMGSEEIYIDKKNDWVVYTADGMPSAQWEIQVLVTEGGYKVLAY